MTDSRTMTEEIMSMRQTGTVSDYCNTFQKWFNQVQISKGFSEFYGIYLFIWGLEPKIGDISENWHQYSCNRVEDVISLALKIDANDLQDSFSPFDPTSSFYKKDLEFDTTITLDELMKDNAFFRNGMIQETIIDEVIDDKDLEKTEQRADVLDSLDISENIDSEYKVFDGMPEPIRDEIEAQFSDIYICESLLSERPAQKIAIHEVKDVIVEMDNSKNLIFWHFKNEIGILSQDLLVKVSCGELIEIGSCGDIEYYKNETSDFTPDMVMDFDFFGNIVCFGNFWGQKSLKEGVLGMEMVMENFGWKSGRKKEVNIFKKGKLMEGKLMELRSVSNLVVRMAIGSFGWKPGWISSTNLGSEGSFLDNIDYQGFSLSQNFEWAQGKARKDGDHVVVYEGHEYGLVLVGIDNGLDASDFLTNVYHSVHKELKREGNHPAGVILLAVLGTQTSNVVAASISDLRWFGKAEGEKLYIVEETASGYTTLVALASKETFKTGAYLYGVAEAFKHVASQDTEKNVKINVQGAYSTKRSTRLTEKECARIGVIQDSMHKGSFGNFSKNGPLLFNFRSTHYQLAAQYLKEKQTCFDNSASFYREAGWVTWLPDVVGILIAKDEIFRPLAADVYTQNLATVITLNDASKAGALWVNCFDIIDVAISFKWIQAESGWCLLVSLEFWTLVNKVP